MTTIINMQNVTKTYMMGKVPVQALCGVSFKVKRGDFVSVLGPSGSGKSTLLNLVGALDKPTTGTILINDVDISELNDNKLAELRAHVGFVFQFFNLIPRLNAERNVELPLSIAGISVNERRERVREVLESVGLKDRMYHKPSELSGGERQRVAIARALVTQPSFLLMDEPTGNVDSKTSQEVMDLVASLNKARQITVIIITHDYEIAKRTRRTMRMKDGLIVSDEVQ